MKKSLFFFLLLVVNQSFCQPNFQDSLKLYYPFNEIYTLYVPDESGNFNRGLAYNVEPAEDRFGQQDRALYFRGDSYVKFEAGAFNFLEYTYSAWLKFENQPPPDSAYFIINIGSDYAVDQHVVYTNNYSLFNLYGFTGQGYNTDGSTSWVTQNNIVETGQWNFVVYTRNSKSAKLYVDGVLIDSVDVQDLKPVYGDVVKGFVGCRNNYHQYTRAYIDDVRIYSAAIDKQTINELYLLDILDVATSFSDNNPIVYPNPVRNMLHINLPDKWKNCQLLIYNISGRLLKHFENINDLSVDDLQPGMYFLKINTEASRYNQVVKFVKY